MTLVPFFMIQMDGQSCQVSAKLVLILLRRNICLKQDFSYNKFLDHLLEPQELFMLVLLNIGCRNCLLAIKINILEYCKTKQNNLRSYQRDILKKNISITKCQFINILTSSYSKLVYFRESRFLKRFNRLLIIRRY